MTKGIVICNLNQRSGKPSVNAERPGYYVSGDEVEIVDVVLGETEADYYEGTPTWYKLNNGLYIWSGGVSVDLEEEVFQKKLSLDEQYQQNPSAPKRLALDYNTQVRSKNVLPTGNGNGIRIAVLDSGIDIRHSSLNDRVKFKNHNVKSEDLYPHGTNVAGLLVADDEVVKGLCVQSELYDYQVTNLEKNVDSDQLIQVLDEIRMANELEKNNSGNLKCDILNLSLDIRKDKVASAKTIVEKLYNQGVIMVVAGGNGDDKISRTNFHELDEYLVLVGTFWYHLFDDHKRVGFTNKNWLWFLNEMVPTTDLYPNHTLKFTDSSAYTGIVSGIVSKYLSHENPPIEKRFTSVRSYLKRNSFNIKKETSSKPEHLKLYRNEDT